ncbi:hypothetical protein MNBD_GAMMA25-971 [hydrothermal vent metagenome]|uniref:Uncharacterized protein n=1 Tax=hydrothermal vent metagenome TaxID=652676 RepID=A0A3B1BBN9_9ZZZZ
MVERLGPELINVSLDFNERIMRMSYGDIAAVQLLRDASIMINHSPGLRSALIIIDGEGYIFTPTPLYLEAESNNEMARNALHLSQDQVAKAMARLSPAAAKAIAIARTSDADEKVRIADLPVEVGSSQVNEEQPQPLLLAYRDNLPSPASSSSVRVNEQCGCKHGQGDHVWRGQAGVLSSEGGNSAPHPEWFWLWL